MVERKCKNFTELKEFHWNRVWKSSKQEFEDSSLAKGRCLDAVVFAKGTVCEITNLIGKTKSLNPCSEPFGFRILYI